MLRRALLGSAAVLLATAGALAELKTLVLNDGRRITGDVTRTATGYRVEMALGVLTFRLDQVLKVEDAVGPGSEYQRRRKKIDRKDPEALYKLAEWAFEKELLREARADLQAALKIKPDHQKAALLLKLVESKLGKKPVTTKPVKVTTKQDELDKLLLGEEDIYKVRLAELDLWYDPARRSGVRGNDTQVAIRFQDNVIQRFVESMRGIGDFQRRGFDERFRAFTAATKVAYMLENLSREDTAIRDDILIRSDPHFMREFRRRVWPVISQNCAQAQCHGGPKPRGGMKLFSISGVHARRADYTNFVILSGLRKKRGLRVIDRGEHERSLLLQFGLPPEQAREKHPKQIKTIYADENAVNYRRVLAWIQSLRGPKHPNYRLKYVAPFGMELHTSGKVDLPILEEDQDKTKKKGDKKDELPFKNP